MFQTVTRRTVLCIGNDTEAAQFLRETLAEYEVVVAPNAFEAIRSMHARAFDAYITDFWLSDWAGPQLCRAIREVDPHCPILFWSSAESEQNRQRALRAGASAYFCKQTDAESVKPMLRALLARGDEKSLDAKTRLEAAVVSEIERCKARLPVSGETLDARGTFIERTARKRGYKVFVECGGSRAHFERWWPQVFGSARANHNLVSA
jgi:DNA-binding response OmpR family regulator